MFGLGFSEIVVIAVLALLVFGPEKVPELLGTLGKWMRYARGATNELRRTIETEGRKILPPDLKLPRFDDLLNPPATSSRPASSPPAASADPGAPGAPAASSGPINYGYGDIAPTRRAAGAAATLPGSAGTPDDPEGNAHFDEELDAPGASAGSARALEERDARVNAIARALDPGAAAAAVESGARRKPA